MFWIIHTESAIMRPMKKKTGPGRGGARAGAGRKRLIQDPGRITIDMEKRDLDRLRALAASRAVSASELIRRAVLQYLKRSGG